MLLVALAFAVIGMHNLVAISPMHDAMAPEPVTSASAMVADACCADHAGQPGHAPGAGHDWLHLCLAVLGQLAAAAALLLVLVIALARGAGDRASAWSRALARAPDPPPGNGRTILTSVCVLRL